MSEQKNIVILALILILSCFAASGITMLFLYKTAIQEERERLIETAQSQARLIEAVARFDKTYSHDYPEGPLPATLSQVRDAHQNYKGFGETGEFTLAKLENDKIVFLLSHRHYYLNNPKPVDIDSKYAIPMKLALKGKSGTVIGLDYRGEIVLAAYEPVKELNLGIVAKLDLKEIRAPFLYTALIVTAAIILLVALSLFLFIKFSRPILHRVKSQNRELTIKIEEQKQTKIALQNSEAFLKTLLNEIPIPIFYKDSHGKYIGCNNAFEIFFGKSKDELVGKTVYDINPPELAERYHQKDLELFNTREEQQYESQVKNAKGELRDVVFNKNVFIDAKDNVLGLIGGILDITDRKKAEQQREQLISRLKKALDEVKTLSGLLPICASCKKIRDDKGYWNQIESYIQQHSDAEFSHGMCPECSDKFYSDQDWYIEMKKKKSGN